MSKCSFDPRAQNLAVETAAGTGDDSFKNGPAKSAKFDGPKRVAAGIDGEIYVTESYAHHIRVIRGDSVSTFVGSSEPGSNNGSLNNARFRSPAGMAVGHDGAIYVADQGNHVIRKIYDGEVNIIAGKLDEASDRDGDSSHARFYEPQDVCIGPDGALYVCDTKNNKIKCIKNGQVTTFAGCGSEGSTDGPALSVRLNHPLQAIVDSSNTLYFLEIPSNRIRMVKDGQVSTVAGRTKFGYEDGPAESALFERITGLAIDNVGRLFISDASNNRIRILEKGLVSTFAGTGVSGFANGTCRNSRFQSPAGLTIDDAGTLFIADSEDHRVRMIKNAAVMTAAAKASFDLGIAMSSGVPKCGVTKDIDIGGSKVTVHPAFIEVRCPRLSKLSSMDEITIDDDSAEHFINFLYSNKLPDRCDPERWMRLAYLLEQARFPKQASHALREMQSALDELGKRVSVDELVKLYKCALELDDYQPGINACLAVMRTHKPAMAPKIKRVAELLEKHKDAFYDLVRFLIEDSDSTEASRMVSTAEESPSIQAALAKLRNSTSSADFEIHIGDSDVVKCHSFVLYSRWPYFRHMLDAGMIEARSKKLSLPNHDQDGGMHPTCLEAILDVAYLGELQQDTKNDFDLDLALFTLNLNDLYLDGATMPSNSRSASSASTGPTNTFVGLIEFAQDRILKSVDEENVEETCETLKQIGLEQFAERVKEKVGK